MKVNIKLLRFSRLIHVYLSVFLLTVLTFFAVTGITLNHPEWIGSPTITKQTYYYFSESGEGNSANSDLLAYGKNTLGLDLGSAKIEQEEGVLYIDAQKPGRATYVEADTQSGEVVVTATRYGWLATLIDLHKGRHAEWLWRAVIDLSGFLVLLFSVTGLIILLPQKKRLKKVVRIGVAVSVLCGWIALL